LDLDANWSFHEQNDYDNFLGRDFGHTNGIGYSDDRNDPIVGFDPFNDKALY